MTKTKTLADILNKHTTLSNAIWKGDSMFMYVALRLITLKRFDVFLKVHCVAGMSRSSSIVAAYLMKEFGMSAKQALFFTKKRRPIIRPNKGFLHQLIQYEDYLKQ